MRRGAQPRKGVPYLTVEFIDGHIRGDGLVRYDELADTITRALYQIGVKARAWPSVPLPPD